MDHISGLGELCRLLRPAYVYLRGPDQAFYASPENSLPPYLPAAKDLPAVTGSTEDSDFKVIPLPGHTPGGSGFLFRGDPPALVVGDTIFAGSVGRTDLPGGDTATLLDSIRGQFQSIQTAGYGYSLEEESDADGVYFTDDNGTSAWGAAVFHETDTDYGFLYCQFGEINWCNSNY